MANGKNIRLALEERKLQLIEEINNVLKELDEFNLFYFSNTLDESEIIAKCLQIKMAMYILISMTMFYKNYLEGSN